MQQIKRTIPQNAKRKQFGYVSPFQSYHNYLTKQRNQSYMPSSYTKTNRSVLEFDDGENVRGQLCLKHSIGLNCVCFTCGFKVYCSQCLIQTHNKLNLTKNKQETMIRSQLPKSSLPQANQQQSSITNQPVNTQNHDIRPIQKSFIFVRNSLIECQIRLQAKCNILTNMNEQVHNQKIQLYNEKNEYKLQLQRQFEYIYQVLRQKQQQMQCEIEQIFVQNERKYVVMIDEIKSLQQYYDQCQQSIANVLQQQSMINTNPNIQKDSQLHTCLFYSQHAKTISQLFSDQQIDSIKNSLYSLNFKLQNHNLNEILNYINQLEIGYDQKFIYKNIQQSSQSNSLQKQLHKIKSQTLINAKPIIEKKPFKKSIPYSNLRRIQKNPSSKTLHQQQRNQKQRQSHKVYPTFGTSTPKALSKETKIQFLKKSPQNNLLKKRKKSNVKMISMPASPAKQEKQQRAFSPKDKTRDFILQGMKKKTTIAKKKK